MPLNRFLYSGTPWGQRPYFCMEGIPSLGEPKATYFLCCTRSHSSFSVFVWFFLKSIQISSENGEGSSWRGAGRGWEAQWGLVLPVASRGHLMLTEFSQFVAGECAGWGWWPCWQPGNLGLYSYLTSFWQSGVQSESLNLSGWASLFVRWEDCVVYVA